MAARNLSAASLPRMSFSKDDEARYREVSAAVVAETVALYEEFLYGHGRSVDKQRWKLVKERESVYVYRARGKPGGKKKPGHEGYASDGSGGRPHLASQTSGSYSQYGHLREAESSASSIDTTGMGPGAALAAKSRLPVMIATAAIPGSIEDAMYGAFVDDSASFRRRSFYQQDQADDCVMLATIDTPSKEDPFRFLGLAWILRNFNGLGAVVKSRDFLFLQCTGMTRSSRGEQIGYAVMHSVPHRDLPELQDLGIVRGQMSVCALSRQMGDQVVDVFMQTVMHPGGNVANFFSLPETATAMLAAGKPMNSAQKKKLFWMMRKRAKASTSGPISPTSSISSGGGALGASIIGGTRRQPQESDHCSSCKKPFGRLFSGGGTFCQICQQHVCSRCSVSKKIVIDATDKAIVVRPFNFCIACTLSTRGCSALQVHADELSQRQRM